MMLDSSTVRILAATKLEIFWYGHVIKISDPKIPLNQASFRNENDLCQSLEQLWLEYHPPEYISHATTS